MPSCCSPRAIYSSFLGVISSLPSVFIYMLGWECSCFTFRNQFVEQKKLAGREGSAFSSRSFQPGFGCRAWSQLLALEDCLCKHEKLSGHVRCLQLVMAAQSLSSCHARTPPHCFQQGWRKGFHEDGSVSTDMQFSPVHVYSEVNVILVLL